MYRIYPSLLLACSLLPVGHNSHAANVPQISAQMKAKIQGTMKEYIAEQTVDGKLYVFDAVQNKLLKLTFGGLHSGLMQEGGVYLTCADFVDQDGEKIDLDFMVRPTKTGYIATQSIVHAVNEKYRPYHVSDRNE